MKDVTVLLVYVREYRTSRSTVLWNLDTNINDYAFSSDTW